MRLKLAMLHNGTTWIWLSWSLIVSHFLSSSDKSIQSNSLRFTAPTYMYFFNTFPTSRNIRSFPVTQLPQKNCWITIHKATHPLEISASTFANNHANRLQGNPIHTIFEVSEWKHRNWWKYRLEDGWSSSSKLEDIYQTDYLPIV